jgi:protein subunit release factor A
VVRVEILPAPFDESPYPREEVLVETRPLSGIAGRLVTKPRIEVRVMHRPSMTSVRAWAATGRNEALERVTPLLRARVERNREETPRASSERIVRRYTLGPTPLVRDRRSGRSSGRIDRVLKGDLDRFLAPPDEGK